MNVNAMLMSLSARKGDDAHAPRRWSRAGQVTALSAPSDGGDSGVMDVLKTLASGTAGGIAQVLAGHPFDTVKTKLQVQAVGDTRYTGMIQCFREVVRTEGAAGLYRGAMSPLVGAMAHNANVFFSFSMSKHLVANTRGVSVSDLTVPNVFTAGAIAGVAICAVEVPVDLFKIKMQQQGANGEFTGSFDAARKIFSRYGVRGIYQGTGATMLRNIPAFGMYFGAFEWTRRKVTTDGQPPTLFSSFLAGSAAGFAFWVSVYPLEMVKTRMQAQPTDVTKRMYSSSIDCIRQTLAKEGVAGMFKGFVPCVTRAVPVNGAIFFAVAYAKSLISDESL